MISGRKNRKEGGRNERERQLRWTKKDFEVVAQLLANALRAAKGKDEREGVKIVATLCAFALQRTNPNYDMRRFLDAVGVSFGEITETYEKRNLAEALN
jgi:hypothetical protein